MKYTNHSRPRIVRNQQEIEMLVLSNMDIKEPPVLKEIGRSTKNKIKVYCPHCDQNHFHNSYGLKKPHCSYPYYPVGYIVSQ